MPGHDLGHELKSEWVEDIRDWSRVTLAPGTVHMATKEAEQGSASRSPAVDEKMFGEVDGALGVQSASLGVHPPVLQTPSSVLSSLWASVSPSVKGGQQFFLVRVLRGLSEMEA